MPALALPDPPLSDAFITLRGFESGDVPALTAACQDPEIPRWTLVPSPYGADDARAFIDRSPEALATGRRAAFAIVGARTGELLGAVALTTIDWPKRAADIGYWLAADARGRGVATRAVELITGWAFETLGLERVELRIHTDNHASQAVAARAGFAPVAAPVVRRPECEHLPDVFFARVRPGG